MAVKVILGVLALGLALIVGVQQYRSNSEKKDRAQRGRVLVGVEDAKANGKREVMLEAPIGNYATAKTVDEALANNTTFIARPVLKATQLAPDSREIQTWYKLKVDEFLSAPKNERCTTCSSLQSVPSQIQPVNADEVVIVRNTGTIVLDGVQVTTIDRSFPDFEINQQYLFFLSLDPATRLGSLELGPAGVSVVQQDGEISPISEKSAKLVNELKGRYGNINRIRSALRFRRFPE